MAKLSGEDCLAQLKANVATHPKFTLHEAEMRPVGTSGLMAKLGAARPIRDQSLDNAGRLIRQALDLLEPPRIEPAPQTEPELSAPGQLRPLKPLNRPE